MVDIYLSSFFREDMTQKVINLLQERTPLNSYKIHIFDNGSNKKVRDYLCNLLDTGVITSLHLDSRNTGCLYNKAVFHAMTETKDKYFVISDNDIFPPKLTPDWLTQMTAIMDAHPELAFLTPQFPPVQLMSPEEICEDIVYCKAVGNAFKMVRRKAISNDDYEQSIGTFGDDGLLSEVVRKKGWRVAFCRKIFVLHAGQCKNWGYNQDEIDKDPRKKGYGPPYIVPTREDTFEPLDPKFVI
jgi:cellulose synthase/poly-beta-1,6-N-acetylglucosamine synthase-like glycosyltransferase